jgi:hypothetical protein
VLAPGATAQGAGFSGTFTTGDARLATRSTRVAEQAAAIDALAPSVAPWVNARVGIGGDNEAGLTYTGRAVRLDIRHAFEDDDIALSMGAGASAVLRGREEQRDQTGTVTRAPWGFDRRRFSSVAEHVGVVSAAEARRIRKSGADASSAIDPALQRWCGYGVAGLTRIPPRPRSTRELTRTIRSCLRTFATTYARAASPSHRARVSSSASNTGSPALEPSRDERSGCVAGPTVVVPPFFASARSNHVGDAEHDAKKHPLRRARFGDRERLEMLDVAALVSSGLRGQSVVGRDGERRSDRDLTRSLFR